MDLRFVKIIFWKNRKFCYIKTCYVLSLQPLAHYVNDCNMLSFFKQSAFFSLIS